MSTASSDRVARTLAGFPRERQWLLPALHGVQHALGWLSPSALADVAAHLRVPASEVFGVATGYPEFRLAPRGRHHARVCTGVSCTLAGGGPSMLEAIAQACGVTPGETGAERELTLQATDCFFQCAVAPLVEVDGELHGRVTLGDAERLDDWFSYGRRHGGPPPTPQAPGMAVPRMPATAQEVLARLVADARSAPRSPLRFFVQVGTCGRAVGGGDLLRALRDGVRERRLEAEVVEGACSGACWAAPSVEIAGEGMPRALLQDVEPGAVGALFATLATATGDLAAAGFTGVVWSETPWRGLAPADAHPFWRGQERVLLARAGGIDPESLADALMTGAYSGLARALDGRPEDVIEQVKASGLQGRGGAFFPTALKWEACRRAPGPRKFVVMNGEEGEPGIFKDRHLMEGDPHQVLEGVLLAAWSAGAERAILYIHGEAKVAAERMGWAVAEARAASIVGERVLGRDFACEVEIRRGAGGFVLGEETALLESIEGRRAQPRTRPPFPVESGLWGRPTVINNVETLAAGASIVARGGAWFAALGTPAAPGTKVFGLSGPIKRPGVVEARNGGTLRALLDDIGGGATSGRPLKGAVVGGPSGSVVPAALLDVPLEPRGRVSAGTGGVIGVPEGASVAEIVRTLVEFNAHESCGKCTPCREGLPRLLTLIDALGRAPDTETGARALAETIQLASLCGLGQAAPLAWLRGLEAFRAELGAGP